MSQERSAEWWRGAVGGLNLPAVRPYVPDWLVTEYRALLAEAEAREDQQPTAADVIAVAERALQTLTPSHRAPGCYCQHWIDIEKFGHCDKCKEAVSALATIAKWKEVYNA